MNELHSITKLKEALAQFPSIGEKTAERMAYALLDMDEEKINFILDSIKEADELVHICPTCGILIDTKECPVCENLDRDHSICLVVSYPKDIIPFEKTNAFKGTYHVLNGEISSIKGIGIYDLNIKKLEERIKKENIKEVIIATNPTLEGETTSLYIAKLLEKYEIKVTRLARGIPMGGSLEYSDELTLIKALEGRGDI